VSDGSTLPKKLAKNGRYANGVPICGNRKRQEPYDPCGRPAGWGTDHPGEGKCKLHGGAALITHGRYSKIQRPRIKELIEQYEADPDPLNMLAELSAQRALTTDFIERWEENSQALVAWWQSWSLSHRAWSVEEIAAFRDLVDEMEARVRDGGEEISEDQAKALGQARSFLDALAKGDNHGRPKQVLDLGDAVKMLDLVSKTVERIERIRTANVVTKLELFRVMGQMGGIVRDRVKDPETVQAIIDGWQEILVSPSR
jgi:hypothetical protein